MDNKDCCNCVPVKPQRHGKIVLDNLSRVAERAEVLAKELIERTALVCSDVKPEECCGKPSHNFAEYFSEMDDCTTRITRALDAVVDVLERLEV